MAIQRSFYSLFSFELCDWEYMLYLMRAWVTGVKQTVDIAVNEERYTRADAPKHCKDQEGRAEDFTFAGFAGDDATDKRED
jgi:hypothetical protein